MGRRYDWISEGWFGPPGCGKTARMAGRAIFLASRNSISSVFYLDPPGDWSFDFGEVYETFDAFDERLYSTERLPRLAVFQLGLEPENYREVFACAQRVGGCVIVVDEVKMFAPGRGKPFEPLARVASMGRHLPDESGQKKMTHLVVGSQRPADLNAEIRDNLRTICVANLPGRSARNWIRDEVNERAVDILDNLGPHDFVCVRPRLSDPLPTCRKVW